MSSYDICAKLREKLLYHVPLSLKMNDCQRKWNFYIMCIEAQIIYGLWTFCRNKNSLIILPNERSQRHFDILK